MNSRISKFPNSPILKFQISRMPELSNSQIPQFTNSKIPKFNNSKIKCSPHAHVFNTSALNNEFGPPLHSISFKFAVMSGTDNTAWRKDYAQLEIGNFRADCTHFRIIKTSRYHCSGNGIAKRRRD